MACHDVPQFLIRLGVIAVERGYDDSLVNAGCFRAAHVGFKRRDRVPRCGHEIAFTSMAVTINNHSVQDSILLFTRGKLRNFAIAVRYQMLVAIAL